MLRNYKTFQYQTIFDPSQIVSSFHCRSKSRRVVSGNRRKNQCGNVQLEDVGIKFRSVTSELFCRESFAIQLPAIQLHERKKIKEGYFCCAKKIKFDGVRRNERMWNVQNRYFSMCGNKHQGNPSRNSPSNSWDKHMHMFLSYTLTPGPSRSCPADPAPSSSSSPPPPAANTLSSTTFTT